MPDETKKYIHSGATVEELYARQCGKCHLEVEYDEINGTKVFGDIYCTDGDIKLTTATLLNPSVECVKCLTSFIYYILGVENEES